MRRNLKKGVRQTRAHLAKNRIGAPPSRRFGEVFGRRFSVFLASIQRGFEKLSSVSSLSHVEMSMPPKVIRKIFRRNALESGHPSFEPRIVSVDIVDIEGAARLVFRVRRHNPQGDFMLFGEFAISAGAIRE